MVLLLLYLLQEMQQPEDIGGGDGAFPLPTTDMGHVKGALKYAQVGPDAAYCLLHEMVDAWLS